MYNVEDRYYELENLICNLDRLINDLKSKDDIETFQILKYDYEKEFEELEPIMQKIWYEEQDELNREYVDSVL